MSTDLARREHTEALPAIESARSIAGAIEELRAIRTFVSEQFREGHDFGKIPGCGDKPTLFLPGGQKAVMYFNSFAKYRVKTVDLGNGHAEFQVTTTLISRASQLPVGEGIGSASTKEKKFTKGRGASKPACPSCGKPLFKSKEKPEFFCWRKEGGCGLVIAVNDPKVRNAVPADTPDDSAYEMRNTVLKMAKKRSFVDAAITLACLSELFTQDIEDTFHPADVQAVNRSQPVIDGEIVEPPCDEEWTRPGDDKQLDRFVRRFNEWGERRLEEWDESWSADFANGLDVPSLEKTLHPFQIKNHLFKWAVDRGFVRIAENASIRGDLMDRFLAVVPAAELKDEMNRYFVEKTEAGRQAFLSRRDAAKPTNGRQLPKPEPVALSVGAASEDDIPF